MSVDRIKDYEAIREGAALGSIAPRAAIGLSGADRASYLQGLLTNEIQSLQPGSGCYSAWLTPQGRMITDMHVLQGESMLLLDVPSDLVDSILQRLDQFLFGEDVQLQSLANALASVWIHGPRAPHVLEQVLAAADLENWSPYRHERLAFEGSSIVLARIDQLGVPGYCAYVEAARRDTLTAALQHAGAHLVGAQGLEAARIESGYPVFGIDMTDDTIPLEAGIENRAISFSKGCYVGQEIIIRVLHRGGGRVARRLVGFRVEGERPERGAKLFASEREVGAITSAAESPRLGVIALGYAHRDFTASGTILDVQIGDTRRRATVTERPIPSAA
jgi:folate-binding protein YgfZ